MSYFDRNIARLRERDPLLAERIEKANPVKVKDLNPTPGDFLDELGARGVVFLNGIGSGKLANEIAGRITERQGLVIFEADIGVMKYALSKRLLVKLFDLPQFMLFVEEIPDWGWLAGLHTQMVNEACLQIEDKGSTSLHPKVYEAVEKRLMEEKSFLDINLGTAMQLGKTFCNSILRNVPTIMHAQGVKALYGLFPQCPAIVVSSGPSLDYELNTLKAAKGKALIIAIDTSLPLLLAHGVVPDVVCGIDPLNDNKVLYAKHKNLLKQIPAIFLAQYTPDIMSSYPGPVFVSSMPSNMMYSWLSPFWEEKGACECFGGSVSHFATQIADWFGCTQIALVGQDLCYKVKYHAGDITKLLHDGMGLEEPDETLIGVKSTNRNKEPVYTKPHLQSFRMAFENKIAACPHLTIRNTSRDGINIKGARFEPLDKWIRKHGIEIDAKMAFDSVTAKKPVHAMDVCVDALDNTVQIFRRIQTASKQIIGHIHEIKKLRQSGNHKEEIRALVRKVEALRPITQHPITALISAYYHHIELYLTKSRVKDIDEIRHKWKRLDAQLDRGLNFYGELREASAKLNQELIILRDRLKRDMAKTMEKADGRQAVND